MYNIKILRNLFSILNNPESKKSELPTCFYKDSAIKLKLLFCEAWREMFQGEKGKDSGPGLRWVSFFPVKPVCVNKWSCSWHSCYVTKTEADQGAVCWCIQSSSYHINWISTDIFWFIMMQELSSAAQRTQETERLHKAIKTMWTDQISMWWKTLKICLKRSTAALQRHIEFFLSLILKGLEFLTFKDLEPF